MKENLAIFCRKTKIYEEKGWQPPLISIYNLLLGVTVWLSAYISILIYHVFLLLGKALLWGARKSSIFRGSAGVLAYHIPILRKTLLVMYSVPLSYSWHRNWFNVRLCPGKCRASKYQFNNLYYRRSPIKGDHRWHYRYLGSRLSFKGSMTSSGQATLQMKVYRV